jgi:hypothetical protein
MYYMLFIIKILTTHRKKSSAIQPAISFMLYVLFMCAVLRIRFLWNIYKYILF